MLILVSSFAYSWSGLPLESRYSLNYELNLELSDDLAEFNDSLVAVPLQNIMWANAIYTYQTSQLVIRTQIIQLQDDQIEDYKLSIRSCETELRLRSDALDTCLVISDKKDGIIKQERRKTWVYRTTTFALIAYAVSTFF